MTDVEKVILQNQEEIINALEILLMDRKEKIVFESGKLRKRLQITNELLKFEE